MGYDWSLLGDDANRLAHFIGNHAFMKMSGGHCAALQVTRTPEGVVKFFCTVYERRPEICRILARGSPECLGELETKAALVPGAAGLAHRDPPYPLFSRERSRNLTE